MIKAFDDAVKLERVAFAQPFNEAYEITNCGRSVKIVLDDYCVHYVRRECKSGKWVLMGRKQAALHQERPQVGQRLIALRVIK